ncbi:MAG: Co2+/Mg2+ efflux protein ApaG [Thermonemataceae bacterium]|nr:Co2+/Mg2+ efflux protein ApaG [Thermonemataceae bacterium]
MLSQITEGVKVSVQTSYQAEYSNPEKLHYAFAYRIRIENESSYTVQLLSRHWLIYDSNGVFTEVRGEGVVGVQPVLEPGQTHEYISGSNLRTDIGKMKGSYLMERLMDGKQFSVAIPEFLLISPYRLN